MKMLDKLMEKVKQDQERMAEMQRKLEESKKLKQMVATIAIGSGGRITHVVGKDSALDNLPPTESIFE